MDETRKKYRLILIMPPKKKSKKKPKNKSVKKREQKGSEGEKKDNKTYHHSASAGLISFAHSTLGYEFLSRYSRIVSYNHIKYYCVFVADNKCYNY